MKRIAIIGGGFSAIALAYALGKSVTPMQVHVFAEKASFGKGRAYGTASYRHILNVPAGKMGAKAGKPHDFYDWMQKNASFWRALSREFAKAEWGQDDFVSRRLYSHYLADVWKEAQAQLQAKGGELIMQEGRVERMLDPRSFLWNGKAQHFNTVILAIGHFGQRCYLKGEGDALYLPDLWNETAFAAFSAHFRRFSQDMHHVAIIGTGLTAIDMLYSLHEWDYQGQITCISREGKFPETHGYSQTSDFPVIDVRTGAELEQAIRTGVAQAGDNWRGFIDAMRPYANRLWAAIPADERVLFNRRFGSEWNRLRHRMPKASQQLIDSFGGRLQLSGGGVSHAERQQGKYAVIQPSGQSIIADAVINASGYSYRLGGDSFTASLLDMGVAPHDMAMGAREIAPFQLLEGLYAIGPIWLGQRWETTAVPDLREQAGEVAEQVVTTI